MAELQCRGTLRNLRGWAIKKTWETGQGTRTCTWGGITLCICMCWAVTLWVAILLKRSQCAGGCCAEHEPTTSHHLNKWNSVTGLCLEGCGWHVKGGDYHLLCSDEASSRVRCLIFCYPCLAQEWFRETGDSPAERDAEMVRGTDMQPPRRGWRHCACLVWQKWSKTVT